MVAEGLRRVAGLALDLVYPPRCVLCRKHGSYLCRGCIESLPAAEGRRCDVCWLPLRHTDCAACAEHPTRLARLRSVWRYEGEVRRLVHAFKFGGLSTLGGPLAAQLVRCFQEQGLDAGLIVPVPLTTARRRERGYNQAVLLARELSRETGLPLNEALRRRGHATPQAASATAEQRRRNVLNVFHLAPQANLEGLRVMLIDDVATTGATLDACAGVLLSAGAESVSGLTLARED
jgi:competence protein ComFC